MLLYVLYGLIKKINYQSLIKILHCERGTSEASFFCEARRFFHYRSE